MSKELIPIGNGYSYSPNFRRFVTLKPARLCYNCFFFKAIGNGCFFQGDAKCGWNLNYKSVSFWLYLDEEESL